MQDTPTLETLTIAGLAHRCTQETDLFFRHQGYDPAYCFELFRRAILHGSQQAHECLYRQYQPLVAGWVERHPSFSTTGEEVQYFVNRAFEKFWRALPAAKFDRFHDLKALLSYLKMCTHSAIVDHSRAQQVVLIDEDLNEAVPALQAAEQDVATDAIDRSQQEDFWQIVNSRLSNEKERAVVYGCFVLALKPRELQLRYGELFPDVKEIYRTKQNVLERLRRDQALIELLGAYA